MAIYLVIALIGGLVCCLVAINVNRNPLGWFVIGFLFPLIGLILLAVLPAGAAIPAAAPAPPSALDDLGKLADLRDRGVLTAQEFDDKKRQILERGERTLTPRRAAEAGAPAVDDAEAKALLAAAQQHHFAKRFADARRDYAQLVVSFPASKQAEVARQQLDNLKDG